MKTYIEHRLKNIAKKIVSKYEPQIIGITGSVGKTSTRQAIEVVLQDETRLGVSAKNFNNEIGVPLTVLGQKNSPGKSMVGWMKVLMHGYGLIMKKDPSYPETLVVEMGADHPGDIAYLMDIAPVDVGVLTNIGPSHLEHFSTIEKVIREKKQIATKVKKGGIAILNIDNEYIREISDKLKGEKITYGFSEDADVQAIELDDEEHDINFQGLRFKLVYKGSAVPVFLPNSFGFNALMASLAAAAVGISRGMNLVDIVQKLQNYSAPAGRMRRIDGIKHTLVIDDTYNASPESTIMGLNTLSKFTQLQGGRRIAVLGDMLELGSMEIEGHEQVGLYCVATHVDILLTVGTRGKLIAQSAIDAGMKFEHVMNVDNSEIAGKELQDLMQQGDVIYVKGSQGVRMEKIVKEVMADPLRAKEFLVRQSDAWLK